MTLFIAIGPLRAGDRILPFFGFDIRSFPPTFAVCRLNKNFQKRIYDKALQRIIAGTGHIITGPGGLTTAATLAPKAKGPKARL